LPQSEVSSDLRSVERVPLGEAGGVNGPAVAALAKVGQLPTAYAFAKFGAPRRLGRGLADPRLRRGSE
jgi:hypothetical protein